MTFKKGHIVSQATKDKQRLARQGKHHSVETKLKIGKSNSISQLGNKHSIETKTKMSLAKLGKKFSDIHKQNLSIALLNYHRRLIK